MELTLKHRAGNVVASAVIGCIVLVFLAAVVFLLPDATVTQRGLLRFFVALSAGLLATFFLGGVVLHGSIHGNSVGASGGFVLFILVQFVVNPWDAQAAVADRVPEAMTPSRDIRDAQSCLRAIGMYTGPANGLPNTQTRASIAGFQNEVQIPATGFLDGKTLVALRTRAGVSLQPAQMPPASFAAAPAQVAIQSDAVPVSAARPGQRAITGDAGAVPTQRPVVAPQPRMEIVPGQPRQYGTEALLNPVAFGSNCRSMTYYMGRGTLLLDIPNGAMVLRMTLSVRTPGESAYGVCPILRQTPKQTQTPADSTFESCEPPYNDMKVEPVKAVQFSATRALSVDSLNSAEIAKRSEGVV